MTVQAVVILLVATSGLAVGQHENLRPTVQTLVRRQALMPVYRNQSRDSVLGRSTTCCRAPKSSFTGLLRARADTALAQRDEVRVSVRPVKSFFLDHATAYGVYAPVRELEVEVQVVNDSSMRTITLEPGFLRAIRWSLRSLTDGEREPLDAWQITDVACSGGARQLQCVAGRQVSLPPGGVLIATFELKTRGVAVGTGKYQLDVDLRSAKSMLREGETVSTVNLLDHGSVPIDVHGIEQIEDEKRAHRIEGGRAFAKRDFALALRHFQQINAIDPGDTTGLAGAGDALAGLGRLGEAAQLFERVLPTVGPDSSVPVRLAAIYIALDREEKALDLLNARYPRATVVEMLPHLRRQASTLTKRKKRLPPISSTLCRGLSDHTCCVSQMATARGSVGRQAVASSSTG